jgi:hypothetical protein
MFRHGRQPVHERGGLFQQGGFVVADRTGAQGGLEIPVQILVRVGLGGIRF